MDENDRQQSYPLKYHLIQNIKAEQLVGTSTSTESVTKVFESYRANIRRITELLMLPPHSFYFGDLYRTSQNNALIQVFGNTSPSQEQMAEHGDKAHQWTRTYFENYLLKTATDVNERAKLEDYGIQTFEYASNVAVPVHIGGETVLMSALVMAYSSFEILCQDLWIAAVNDDPELAKLQGRGKGNRIHKRASGRTRKDDKQQSKDDIQISLNTIQRYAGKAWDLSNSMGSLLAHERFRFTSLEGIRQAYSHAFPETSESDQIESSLADQKLDSLNLMRNIIIHNAGVPTEQDAKTLGYDPIAKWVPIGERVIIDAQLVEELLNSLLVNSLSLVTEIDKWIAQKHQETA